MNSSSFDVDVVFTWVDGADPKHMAERAKYIKTNKTKVHWSSHQKNRWRSSGEIDASVQSILKFMPWVRKIFIVCSLGQKPSLSLKSTTEQNKIVIVQDYQFCPMTPIFNSHAIEANLHKIPDLANHFIYFCDDEFVGSPLHPSFFFQFSSAPGGNSHHKPKIFTSSRLLPSHPQHHATSGIPGYLAARINDGKLLTHLYGKKARREPIHQARPLSKECIQKAWSHPILHKHLAQTSRSRFRSPSDVEPVILFSWVGIETSLCVASATGVRSIYLEISDHCNLDSHAKKINLRKPHLYCFNDVMKNPSEKHLRAYEKFLKKDLLHCSSKVSPNQQQMNMVQKTPVKLEEVVYPIIPTRPKVDLSTVKILLRKKRAINKKTKNKNVQVLPKKRRIIRMNPSKKKKVLRVNHIRP